MKKYALLVVAVCFATTPAWAQQDTAAGGVPKVLLSDQHQEMVKIGVGDKFPEVTLPPAAAGGESAPMVKQFGQQVTVVGVFSRDGAMAKTMLRDLQFDINKQYNALNPGAGMANVLPVAIATGLTQDQATQTASAASFEGTLLLDGDGTATAALGTGRMPRIYVLDSKGSVVWFDIEYSSSTRREMQQAVAALIKQSEASN
ncbi:redoxin family protein [Aeoliella mucimassa]|uniref:redoxin family protein n=1 Tax=Aeoliella mucimassa TaxID=2527972 RepID=UPI0011A3690E|nr:redoxin family protein [Aeoliella mucimassa]